MGRPRGQFIWGRVTQASAAEPAALSKLTTSLSFMIHERFVSWPELGDPLPLLGSQVEKERVWLSGSILQADSLLPCMG